jgi:sarcosine oxidase/L-pipecolate oxidase
LLSPQSQTVATIQLSKEEAERYRDVPVVLDFRSGFYVFPVRGVRAPLSWASRLLNTQFNLPTLQPTDDNIVKLALHASGVLHHPQGDTDKPVSTPRTITSHGDDGLRVPRSSLRRLRSELRGIYPELAEKPFAATRLCW